MVQRYLDEGFDVYLIDWGTPTSADRLTSLAHYVRDLLGGVVQRILREHGSTSLHLLGYCMGGTLSALHAALEPRSVATLTLLAAPIDFAGRESLLNVWADGRYFDVDAFNLLNLATTLGKEYDLNLSTGGNIIEIMNPRIVRFGVRIGF